MMGAMDSVPKQCFQSLIPLKVANGSLALQIGTNAVWVQKQFWVLKNLSSKKILGPKKF